MQYPRYLFPMAVFVKGTFFLVLGILHFFSQSNNYFVNVPNYNLVWLCLIKKILQSKNFCSLLWTNMCLRQMIDNGLDCVESLQIPIIY